MGRYRDALGAMPPGGIPAAFLEPVPDALRSLVRRYARWRGPFPLAALAGRYDLEPAVAERELAALEREGILVRGALRPGGSGREWCDVEVLRRIRRASVARLRREVEAVEQPALARFLPAWHGVGRKGRGGVDRLREVLFPLQRLPLAPEVWERQVLPLRMDYRPELLDQLCTSGEVVWLGADSGRVAIAFREDAALLGPPPGPGAAARRSRLRGRARGAARRAAPRRAVRGDRPGRGRGRRGALAAGGLGRGHERRLGAAAAHAPGSGAAHARAARRHAPAHAPPPAAARRGARPLGADRSAARRRRSTRPTGAARSPSCCSSATACSCAPPSSPRASPAGLRACGARSASSRRSASRAAATSSTASAARSTRSRVPSSACARCATPRPTRRAHRARGQRSRKSLRHRPALAGAARRAVPRARPARWSCCATASRSRSSSAERARCSRCSRSSPAGWAAVAEALATASLEGRAGSLQLERIDGEPATGRRRRGGVHRRGIRRRARSA